MRKDPFDFLCAQPDVPIAIDPVELVEGAIRDDLGVSAVERRRELD